MQMGRCMLCDEMREIVQSDIWSRFGYKMYAADQSKGGVFVNLKTGVTEGERWTEPLFCTKCDNHLLSRHETKAAKFCRELEKSPDVKITYGSWMLPFLTSLSLRVVLVRSSPEETKKKLAPVIRKWREFLLNKCGSVGLYNQHLFIIFDPVVESHMSLCARIDWNRGFAFTQFGPLWIFGMLGPPTDVSLKNLRAWENSRISPDKGNIYLFRSDLPIPANTPLPAEFKSFLGLRNKAAIWKAKEFEEKQKQRLAQGASRRKDRKAGKEEAGIADAAR